VTTQEQVREWWSRNPMSYDVDDPIPFEEGSQQFFREIDRRIFHPRYMRLTADESGKPFSLFVDFAALSGKDVLDVGCGSGIATQMLAEAGAMVTAIDLTSWAVETTRRRLAAFGLDAKVLQEDAERLPFGDSSFDLVFSWGVIHHSSDMDRALSELVRVTRPGGEVVLMVYHRRSLFFSSTAASSASCRWRGGSACTSRAREQERPRAWSRDTSRSGSCARSWFVRACSTSGSSRTGRTPSCCRCRGGSDCRSPSASPDARRIRFCAASGISSALARRSRRVSCAVSCC
jgi:2-polyprenyl-3-methyl-5-hydroxy-6-metoxy-1,4-benzoquinol methylase